MFGVNFLNDLTEAAIAPIARGMMLSLRDIRRDIGDRLAIAVADRKSPMHTPVVATGDVDARVMVLREFDSSDWSLRFHTDTRAPKVAAIDGDPRIAVLFYDKDAKIQMRVRGTGAVVRNSAEADAAWSASNNFARRCYLGEGPGAVSDQPTSGLPPEFEGVEPSDEQIVPARENFAILKIAIESVDWLYLKHTGHVRAQFKRDANGQWDERWVSP